MIGHPRRPQSVHDQCSNSGTEPYAGPLQHDDGEGVIAKERDGHVTSATLYDPLLAGVRHPYLEAPFLEAMAGEPRAARFEPNGGPEAHGEATSSGLVRFARGLAVSGISAARRGICG